MHWYHRTTGEPTYEVPNKSKGGTRPTTLRDARKLDLVPSVTTIMQMLNKEALNNYIIDQILKACMTNPFNSHWHLEDEYKGMIRGMARKEGNDAAELGNRIHDALESHYKVKAYPEEYDDYVKDVSEFLDANFGLINWVPEKSFGHDAGFGGKCDLHADGIVLDFKTKSAPDFSKVKAYDEHCMQLAAYREGLGIPTAKCYNLFISTHESSRGELKLHEWKEEELQRGWRMFQLVLALWREVNNFGV